MGLWKPNENVRKIYNESPTFTEGPLKNRKNDSVENKIISVEQLESYSDHLGNVSMAYVLSFCRLHYACKYFGAKHTRFST